MGISGADQIHPNLELMDGEMCPLPYTYTYTVVPRRSGRYHGTNGGSTIEGGDFFIY